MHTALKRTMLLLGGICSLILALGFAFLLLCYLTEGAGLQFFPLGISSGSVLVGLIHVVGLVLATLLCFIVGVCLCASGAVSHRGDS